MQVDAVGKLLQGDRRDVVGGKDRRHWAGAGEKVEKGPLHAVDQGVVRRRRPADPQRRAKVSLLQRSAIARPARPVRFVFQLGDRQVRDAPMAGLDQVGGAEPAAQLVVDRDDVAPVGSAADEDRGDLVLHRLAHRSGIARERQEDDAGHAVLEEGLDAGELALAVALRVAEHRGVAPRRGVPLDRLRHLGEEGVGEVPDHHPEHARPLLHELAREDVRAIAELVDGRTHAAPGGVRNAGQPAHDVGDRGLGHPGVGGHVQDGRVATFSGGRLDHAFMAGSIRTFIVPSLCESSIASRARSSGIRCVMTSPSGRRSRFATSRFIAGT